MNTQRILSQIILTSVTPLTVITSATSGRSRLFLFMFAIITVGVFGQIPTSNISTRFLHKSNVLITPNLFPNTSSILYLIR